MNNEISRLSVTARRSVQVQDWRTVDACAAEILRLDPSSPEGHFLAGLVQKVSQRPAQAVKAFETVLSLDAERYDAAVELANQYSIQRRNGDVVELLEKYEHKLLNSPVYLDLAGTTYCDVGMPQKAWPLYQKANELQPGVDLFQANLAACGVYLGKIKEAKSIYQALLERFPGHRRNHYQLARLEKATDASHIDAMKSVLSESNDTPDKNIFMYFAIAKELEDLGRWEESFEYYKMGGDAVTSVANYDIRSDIELIDTIIDVCNESWMRNESSPAKGQSKKTPIFIVGLPRTGTTLTERIISSHSQVESVGETQFLQMVLRRESGVATIEGMNSEIVRALKTVDMSKIATGYLESVSYRLGAEPMFIEKLPFNFLFLGFIAKAFPEARIVHLHRHPMDACFSMYKQIFTWAYKFSYSLENLGTYYIAHSKLAEHWRRVLGNRLIEVDYETLVANQEAETRSLLDQLGLPFETACLEFDKNTAPSATASSVQIRERVYTGSVNKWTRFADQLEPLRRQLEDGGIEL